MPELPKGQEGARTALINSCKQAADVVAQKSPAEAEEYKRWLVLLAQKTAEAAKEGGFLGIGFTRVIDAEVTALKDLAAALGVNV